MDGDSLLVAPVCMDAIGNCVWVTPVQLPGTYPGVDSVSVQVVTVWVFTEPVKILPSGGAVRHIYQGVRCFEISFTKFTGSPSQREPERF